MPRRLSEVQALLRERMGKARLNPFEGVEQADQGDVNVGEVGASFGGALASLAEAQFERDVGVRLFDRFKMDDGIHLPLARLGAIGTRFVVAGVMGPDLSDAPPR